MSEIVQASSADPAPGRRRFMKRAGLAAGAAYVAPAILGATPASAQTSGCVPQTTIDEGPCPGNATFGQELPPGCATLWANVYSSQNGGPFTPQACFLTPGGASVSYGSALRSTTLQFRFDWSVSCGGTVLYSFTSSLYPACPSVGAPVDPSGDRGDRGELIITDIDGTETRIPSP